MLVASDEPPPPAVERPPVVTSVLDSKRCAEARAWADLPDPAERVKLVLRLFNCFWNRTDELESDEERGTLERDRLKAKEPRTKSKARGEDPPPAAGPLKELEDRLSALAAELVDVAAQRQQLIDQHPADLLPMQLEELNRRLGEINEKIASVEQSKAVMSSIRRQAAMDRDVREAARLSEHLLLFDRELQHLRGKRRNYTEDRFAVRKALGVDESDE